MKQKAYRLQTTVHSKDRHVYLIGGAMNGRTMSISTAHQDYGLDLDIDETKLATIIDSEFVIVDLAKADNG